MLAIAPQRYSLMTQRQRRALRLHYIEAQNGKCWHCKEDLTGSPSLVVQSAFINELAFPSTFFQWPIHLHHDHQTDMTIGAVHCECNAYLWQYHKH